MSESNTWDRMESLFHAAMELPAAEREAFLREACGDDEPLRRAVAELIAADGGAIDFDELVAGAASDVLEDQAEAIATRRFGPYRIVREIGAGGMGTVFLGERADDQYEKQVAIKVVRGGITDAAGRARFEFERQILASLEHPGIARLLDGGTTSDGVPFVVMEYVDGQPITEYADAKGLDTAGRLWLFLDVCAAVQHAHNALVIHRDLKPGNILVAENGQPKLLDFGIAKLLEDDGSGMTRTGAPQPLTPEYASPEQVRGEKVGTGTDVYALGVLLYELLSGARPFDLAGESAAAIEKVITGREPTPPSRVPDLGRRIHPDLDSIVLMALRKDVSRRYPSVAHLADDIRAHLAEKPVTARPNSLAYRAGKFIRRNRLAVSAAAAIVLITIFSAFRLSAERDAARLEAERARQVTSFVTGLFELADPDRSRGADLTAREILDAGIERLRTELADQPDIRSTMYGVVGDVYISLGLDTEAEPVLREALDVAVAAFGTDSREAMAVRAQLDNVLWRQGKAEEAIAMSEAVLAFHRANPSDDPRPLLQALQGLGNIRRSEGDGPVALSLANEMIDVAETRLQGASRDSVVSNALSIRGLAYLDEGQFDEAIADLTRTLEMEADQADSDASEVLTSKNNLATAYLGAGDLDEGERLLREIAEAEARILGPRHGDVGISLHNLAVVLKQKGDFAEAERVQLQALDIHREARGEESPVVASAYNNLANLREDQGDPEGAIEWHQRALALSVATFGEESEQASLTYYNLGGAYRAAGDLVNAERFQRRALAVDSATLGPEHPVLIQDLRSLSVTLQDLNRLEEADALVLEALALAERVLPPDHPELARTRSKLAEVELRDGRPSEAVPLLREALRALRVALDEDHWDIGHNESLLGAALWDTGDRDEAAGLLRSGYAKLVAGRGEEHPLSAAARERLERVGLRP